MGSNLKQSAPVKTGKRLLNNLTKFTSKLFGSKKSNDEANGEENPEEEDEGFNVNMLKRLRKYKLINSVKKLDLEGKHIIGIDPQIQGRIVELNSADSN